MGSEDATGRGLPHRTSVVAEPGRGVNGEGPRTYHAPGDRLVSQRLQIGE
jgi:hypothetical protein